MAGFSVGMAPAPLTLPSRGAEQEPAGSSADYLGFCESYDLPVPDFAIENAHRHGWKDKLELAAKQAERHEYLQSLTSESRLRLFKMQRYMERLEDDREMALKGYTNTSPGCWHWPRLPVRKTPGNRYLATSSQAVWASASVSYPVELLATELIVGR